MLHYNNTDLQQSNLKSKTWAGKYQPEATHDCVKCQYFATAHTIVSQARNLFQYIQNCQPSEEQNQTQTSTLQACTLQPSNLQRSNLKIKTAVDNFPLKETTHQTLLGSNVCTECVDEWFWRLKLYD